MKLFLPDGRVLGGADALMELVRPLRWAWPLRLFSRLPGGMRALRHLYRWVADRRPCADGHCHLLAAPLLLPLPSLPPWALMWLLALSLFACFKLLTLRLAPQGSRPRAFAYLFLWPGMDARAFLDETQAPALPSPTDWTAAGVRALLGAFLIWTAAPLTGPPLLRGWIGMLGLILLLHFGTFQLLALAWRRAGIAAEPLMRSPLRATSLGELWGSRWNRAFSSLTHRIIFRPLAPRLGAPLALLAVFLFSGLLHDLVISVPARGGLGLPTAYFLFQGVGTLFERSEAGSHFGLRRGVRGRAFTLLVAGGPLFWLFHPPFVIRVINPFLDLLK